MQIKEKICLITLGCDKNTVDSERLLRQLTFHKFKIVDQAEKADTIIINTCGFVEDAKQESINTILEAAQLKTEKKLKRVIVFGCLSKRYKDDLIKEIPEVDIFLGVEEYDKILSIFNKDVNKDLLNERVITTPGHYSFLKISEGCNNACSFCAIPLIRGNYLSYPLENLVEEARGLAGSGVKELILVAQDTTYYGLDLYKKRSLPELLNRLTDIDGFEWIRLLYTYPNNFPLEILDIMNKNSKLCRYLDIPLQHISDPVLKKMKRHITETKTKELLYKIRKTVPGISLRTTFIVGHPGETEKEFNKLIDFIKEFRIERVGAFVYSPEENTTGFEFGDPIPEEIKRERLSILMETQKEISYEVNQSMIGTRKKVIIDSLEGEYFITRSQSETPEVDGEILVDYKPGIKVGEFYTVEIYDANEYDLFANFIEE